MCDVCGKPAVIHLTEVWAGESDGAPRKSQRSFCMEHAPAEDRGKMPIGPHRTPAEEAAFLRQQLPRLAERFPDPAQREKIMTEVEQLIADIEAGRRRLGDNG